MRLQTKTCTQISGFELNLADLVSFSDLLYGIVTLFMQKPSSKFHRYSVSPLWCILYYSIIIIDELMCSSLHHLLLIISNLITLITFAESNKCGGVKV